MLCFHVSMFSSMVCVYCLVDLRYGSRVCYVFFFFKQKTAYEMRISDWSSDVCSSDLCPYRLGRCQQRWRPSTHGRGRLVRVGEAVSPKTHSVAFRRIRTLPVMDSRLGGSRVMPSIEGALLICPNAR